jgi:hypothetical protein
MNARPAESGLEHLRNAESGFRGAGSAVPLRLFVPAALAVYN